MQSFPWPVGLLVAAILGLAAYLVVAARRRAAAAVTAERDLRQQVSELKKGIAFGDELGDAPEEQP